jgi:hypothetical protein
VWWWVVDPNIVVVSTVRVSWLVLFSVCRSSIRSRHARTIYVAFAVPVWKRALAPNPATSGTRARSVAVALLAIITCRSGVLPYLHHLSWVQMLIHFSHGHRWLPRAARALLSRSGGQCQVSSSGVPAALRKSPSLVWCNIEHSAPQPEVSTTPKRPLHSFR